VPALDSRVDEFLRAPAAAAMFVLAADRGLDPQRLAEPATAIALASTALRELNPWTGAAAAQRAHALAAVGPLRALVNAVVADPRNAWWSAPLDRTAQLLLTGDDEPRPDPMDVPVPAGPSTEWEGYAQKPLPGVATSTELPVPAAEAIRCGAHAELACGSSDWSPGYPVRQARLHVAPTARVYEVDSAADWHRLVLRYGDPDAHRGSDPNLRELAGIDHGPAPTWSAVADDHDGVHLTFAGLLTGLYVPVTTGRVSTTLWAWEWECTRWLRSAFVAVTDLPDLAEPPECRLP
jgi:hypothetical protein